MRAALVALVACGTPAKPPPMRTDHPPPVIDALPARPDAMAPLVHKGTPRKSIEAPHGGAIQDLAITSDASAAITSDELGGIRLWPKLDGTVEPRIVDLPRSRVLAIGSRGANFAVTAIDDVGGLEIAILDAGGVTLQRASQFADLAYGDVVVIPRGPLATRSDQAVVQLDDNGAILERLDAEPGQRLAGIALAGEHPFALIEKHALEPLPDVDAGVGVVPATEQFARWIEPAEPGKPLRWGEWIDAGVPLGSTVSIAPSGKRLAVLVLDPTRRNAHLLVVELATKKLLADQSGPVTMHVAFVDDDHVATMNGTSLGWLDLAKTTPPAAAPAKIEPLPVRDHAHIETGAGTAIGTRSGDLVIAAPDRPTQFLGYQLQAPHVAAIAPRGRLMIGFNAMFSLLDKDLREVAQPEGLVAKGSAVAQLRWLAGQEWLVESAQSDGTQLSLVDLATGTTQVVRSKMPVVHTLGYEPSTRLVTLSYGDAPEIDRYDPEHHRLDRVLALPPPKSFEQRQLVPVQPALASGNQLVYIQLRDKLAVRWLHDPMYLDKGVLFEPEGSLAGVDGAGHLFVWQNRPGVGLELVAFFEGKEVGVVSKQQSGGSIWPDPKGTRVVELAQRSISLVGLDGTRAWALPVDGTTEALWLDDGGLALLGTGGLARVDAATGTVTAARCGWRFGLAARPHPISPRIEPICSQLLGN